MKIVRIIGGLGNQMFQYAFAIALSQHDKHANVKIDPMAFHGYPLHDGFLLDYVFPISLPVASLVEIVKCNYLINHYRIWQLCRHILPKHRKVYFEKEDMVFDSMVLDDKSKSYFDGYWQSEQYFNVYRSIILSEFKFPELDKKNAELMNSLKDKIITSIHVRRGDYLNNPLFKNLSDLDYYKKAINYLKQKTSTSVYLIFSNDIKWCKDNLLEILGNHKIIFVNWNKGIDSFRDMQLMSLCHHNITANSSFSWWGAWLNQNEDKIVICPRKWMNVEKELDIIPESWHRI